MTFPQPSSSSAPRSPQDGAQEPDELTRFRDNWKHEVGLHHLVDSAHESPADTIPPVDGLPVTQHYSVEELPQAQDSFVSLQYRTSPFCMLMTSRRRPSSTFSSAYISQRTHMTQVPSQRALYPRSSRVFPKPSHSSVKKKRDPYTSPGSRMKCLSTSSGSWITEASNGSPRSVARPASSL